MLRLICLVLISSLLTVCTLSPALAQEARIGGPDKTQIVTASVTTDGVRISAPSAVVQLRLEVYDDAGQKLLDTEQSGGNVLDWHLQGNAGERVADGTYLLVVNVKNPGGQLSRKLGLVNLSAQSTTLRPADVAELNPQQAQVAGLLAGEAEGLAVVPAENTPPLTVLAHTGDEAQITRTRGPLTFRNGDFFSGTDREQMRITPDGRVGIGTDNPQATLDVAGTIQARGGIQFEDGSVLKSANNVENSKGASVANGVLAPNSGTGTTNKIAKWADASGGLTDSNIAESGGRVGIGTTTPGDLLDVVGPANGASRSGLHVGTTTPTGNATVYFDNDRGNFSSYGGVITGGSQNPFAFFGVPRADRTFLIADGATSQGLGIGTLNNKPAIFGTNNLERMRITESGNVGVGTTAPTAKLEVGGDLRIVGAGNGLYFPDGTKMTTASAPGGSMTGTNIVSAINDAATAGTIADARLSGNVARLGSANTFGASQTVNGNLAASGAMSTGGGITAGGTVQSTSGGFRFPDGSVQATAADKVYTSMIFGSTEIAAQFGISSVAELTLPPGNYLVTASVQFENRGLFNKRLVECQMIDEALWFARIEGAGGAMDNVPVTLHTVITHGGNIKLYCQAIDGGSGHSNIFASARRLTAVRIGDLVTQ